MFGGNRTAGTIQAQRGGDGIDNQPIVFNIRYTPYTPQQERRAGNNGEDTDERSFYDMTGEKNVLDYITTEGKRAAGNFTVYEYLQKNTGVFNDKGMLSKSEVAEMKARLKENKGNIWHGFISFNEQNSPKIDTPEKCIAFVKNTFGTFFREAHLDRKNIDLMCALHVDRPQHLHIHFVFWEKEPKCKGKNGTKEYRRKGKLSKDAIDAMFIKSGIFVSEDKDDLHEYRQTTVQSLRAVTAVKRAMNSTEAMKKEILALCKDLPPKGRLSYGSKDMEPYRNRIDKIVRMLLAYDERANRADIRFHMAVAERQRQIQNICGKSYAFSDKRVSPEAMEKELPKYHYNLPDRSAEMIAEIEADYRRRQGNLVVNLCKFIKPEYYERKPGKKYKTNDDNLKRRLHVSKRSVGQLFGRFFASFGIESELLERDFTHRLQDIEKEIENARALQTQSKEKGNEEAESDTK